MERRGEERAERSVMKKEKIRNLQSIQNKLKKDQRGGEHSEINERREVDRRRRRGEIYRLCKCECTLKCKPE